MNDMAKIEVQLEREVTAWRGPSRNAQRKESEKANREAREQRITALPRVSRDPCPRCQVRADIGCRHTRPGG